MCPSIASEIDGGKDLPRELLEYLYTSTVTHEIKMLHGGGGSPSTGKGVCEAVDLLQ